jgi:hypothetical protein
VLDILIAARDIVAKKDVSVRCGQGDSVIATLSRHTIRALDSGCCYLVSCFFPFNSGGVGGRSKQGNREHVPSVAGCSVCVSRVYLSR